MRKKGFTLIELLGIIVLLSIIAIISIPAILTYIEKTRISAYKTSAQTLIDTAKEYVSKNMEDNDFPDGGISIEELKVKNSNIKSGVIKRCTEDFIGV